MRRLITLSLLLAAPLAWSAPPTPAQSTKYRHEIMEALGGHMGALAMIAKGESDRTGDVPMHANAIADLSKTVGGLFPEGTGTGVAGLESSSKPEIWSQKTEFAAAVTKFQTAATALAEAAKTNDAAKVKAAMGGVGQSCGGCHDSFKVKDEH